MNKRADSLPPFTVAFVAVALATAAIVLPRFSGTLPARLLASRVSAADAAFSAVLAVCWLYAATRVHIYSDRLKWHVPVARILQCYGLVAALFALYMFAFHPGIRAFRTTAVFLLCMLLCESLWMFIRTLSRSTSRRALVLGTGRVATTVWRDLRTGRLPEMSFAGFTSESFREEFCPDIAARYVGNLSDMKKIVLQQSVDDLIIATPALEGSWETEHAVEVAANLGVRVWTVKQALGVPGYASRNPATEYMELVADPELGAIRGVAKRSLDVILSALALIAGLPIVAVTIARERARGLQLDLERQTRVGLHRRLFRIRRIRSAIRANWLHELLNKYLLMWNVLRGDMSMVGPRALSPEDLARRDVPESAGRFGIRPGLTGGWEFETGRDSAAATVGLGVDYAERWSLTRDLMVLARAVHTFVQRNVVTRLETGAV